VLYCHPMASKLSTLIGTTKPRLDQTVCLMPIFSSSIPMAAKPRPHSRSCGVRTTNQLRREKADRRRRPVLVSLLVRRHVLNLATTYLFCEALSDPIAQPGTFRLPSAKPLHIFQLGEQANQCFKSKNRSHRIAGQFGVASATKLSMRRQEANASIWRRAIPSKGRTSSMRSLMQ
jgi:hypothetical protein